MKAHFVATITFVCCLAGIALAQTAPPAHIRGTISGFDGQALLVTTREGPQVAVTVPATTRVSSMKKLDVSAIGPGTSIGTAAKAGPNGELQAIEILVFPESARGSGAGHYAWDLGPGITMTNATVTAAVESRLGATSISLIRAVT